MGREQRDAPEGLVELSKMGDQNLCVDILDAIVHFKLERLTKNGNFDPKYGLRQRYLFKRIYAKRHPDARDEQIKIREATKEHLKRMIGAGIIYRIWYKSGKKEPQKQPYIHTDERRLAKTDYIILSDMSNDPRLKKNWMPVPPPDVNIGAGWQEQREKCLKRDGRQCRFCGSTDYLHVYHKRSPGDFTEEDRKPDIKVNKLTNLIVLCQSCYIVAERDGLATVAERHR